MHKSYYFYFTIQYSIVLWKLKNYRFCKILHPIFIGLHKLNLFLPRNSYLIATKEESILQEISFFLSNTETCNCSLQTVFYF